MKDAVFYNLFLGFIQTIYDAENQIVKAIPSIIKECTSQELREGLSEHLEETKEQVTRLRRVFELLGETPTAKPCKALTAILEEGKEMIGKSHLTPAMKDCFIIINAQQIEHYEIASYGSLISLIDHIKEACPERKEMKEIYDLMKETIEEEGTADKKLTKVAEGKLFCKGVNEEIEKEIKVNR